MSGLEIVIIGGIITCITIISQTILHLRLKSGCCTSVPINENIAGNSPTVDNDNIQVSTVLDVLEKSIEIK